MRYQENGIVWTSTDPRVTPEYLGLIPEFLSVYDPRPAKEQINENYQHGGGWRDFKGFTVNPDNSLQYPGDPPMKLLIEGKLRDETLRLYDASWFSITDSNGNFSVCRLD
jgi:hypothetical protein